MEKMSSLKLTGLIFFTYLDFIRVQQTPLVHCGVMCQMHVSHVMGKSMGCKVTAAGGYFFWCVSAACANTGFV